MPVLQDLPGGLDRWPCVRRNSGSRHLDTPFRLRSQHPAARRAGQGLVALGAGAWGLERSVSEGWRTSPTASGWNGVVTMSLSLSLSLMEGHDAACVQEVVPSQQGPQSGLAWVGPAPRPGLVRGAA
jgi:hypothetical protein